MPAGSSRVQRLDPFALPVRFEDDDHAADARVRMVEIHRERIVLRRRVRGIKMAVSLPITAYLGVAIRRRRATPNSPGAVVIVLEHADPALSVTLCCATEVGDSVADWRSWGRALGMPLLVESANGGLREPFEHIGGLRIGVPVVWRRRRRSPLRARRASMPLRRRRFVLTSTPDIHRGEREIIARD
jgi:Family of unknown function (DUF6101)